MHIEAETLRLLVDWPKMNLQYGQMVNHFVPTRPLGWFAAYWTEFWTVGQTKQATGRRHLGLWEIMMGIISQLLHIQRWILYANELSSKRNCPLWILRIFLFLVILNITFVVHAHGTKPTPRVDLPVSSQSLSFSYNTQLTMTSLRNPSVASYYN